MTEDELHQAYFEWLCDKINDSKLLKRLSYKKLLWHLFHSEFKWFLKMDENRALDGKDLRTTFSYSIGEDTDILYYSEGPCSVLEMMVALAARCEHQIMDNPEIGDRTGLWFWNMIDSLGLKHMSDSKYDSDEVNMVLYTFMHREYRPNGSGGLFTVHNYPDDLRTAEIWYQMCWYLDEILQNEEGLS